MNGFVVASYLLERYVAAEAKKPAVKGHLVWLAKLEKRVGWLHAINITAMFLIVLFVIQYNNVDPSTPPHPHPHSPSTPPLLRRLVDRPVLIISLHRRGRGVAVSAFGLLVGAIIMVMKLISYATANKALPPPQPHLPFMRYALVILGFGGGGCRI
jgi:hypothetical protein